MMWSTRANSSIHKKRQFSLEGYNRWRRKIPFTDEQIARVLEKLASEQNNEFLKKRDLYFASLARKGYLSNISYQRALSVLVKNCVICGKKAIYRYEHLGRCSEHRFIRTPDVEAKQKELERRGILRTADIIESEKAEMRHRAHKKNMGKRNNSPRRKG